MGHTIHFPTQSRVLACRNQFQPVGAVGTHTGIVAPTEHTSAYGVDPYDSGVA